jgi:hypothetical protein
MRNQCLSVTGLAKIGALKELLIDSRRRKS